MPLLFRRLGFHSTIFVAPGSAVCIRIDPARARRSAAEDIEDAIGGCDPEIAPQRQLEAADGRPALSGATKVDRQDEFALGFPMLRGEVFFTPP